jgi:hypothetical protein
MKERRIELESLVGETLSYIDTDDSGQILLTTQSGRQICIYHEQDCCESVFIYDTKGNWHELIGKPILWANEEIDSPDDDIIGNFDSVTQTKLTFKVDDATVVSRWIGESNGYYSETVDIKEILK